MVMGTRSSLTRGSLEEEGDKTLEQEEEKSYNLQSKENQFLQKKIGTLKEVKVKKETIDKRVGENRPSTNRQSHRVTDKSRGTTTETIDMTEEQEIDTEKVGTGPSVDQNVPWISSTNGSTGTSKRRLSVSRNGKRSKKYYQDISLYMKTLSKGTEKNTSHIPEMKQMESNTINHEPTREVKGMRKHPSKLGGKKNELTANGSEDNQQNDITGTMKITDNRDETTGHPAESDTAMDALQAETEKLGMSLNPEHLEMDEDEITIETTSKSDELPNGECTTESESETEQSRTTEMEEMSTTGEEDKKKTVEINEGERQKQTDRHSSMKKLTRNSAINRNINGAYKGGTTHQKEIEIEENKQSNGDTMKRNEPMQQKNGYKFYKSKFTVIAKSKANVDQLIKERGHKMTMDTRVWETPLKFEFNIDKYLYEYNVRVQTVEMLEMMKKHDPQLKVKSTISDYDEWGNMSSLPEDSEFTDHFQVKEFPYRTHRKVIVHMKLTTKYPVHRLKYTPEVKEYLFTNKIWLKIDRFNAKVESSPGSILMVHPKLINREGLKEELIWAMTEADMNLAQAKEKDSNSSTEVQTKTNDSKAGIPYFYLENSIKRWGVSKVETIRVNCAKEDSGRLKTLLSSAGEQGLLTRGQFLPEGLQLMANKEVVTNMMLVHEQYIKNATGIPLRGLSETDMSISTKIGHTIRDTILEIDGVESIEKMRDGYSRGHWTIISTKQQEVAVLQKIEQSLSSLYSHQSGQTKLITAGDNSFTTKAAKSNSISTYAEILSNKYKGPAVKTTDRGEVNKDQVSDQSTTAQLSMGKNLDTKRSSKKSDPGIKDTNNEQDKTEELRNKIDAMETQHAEWMKEHKRLLEENRTNIITEQKQIKTDAYQLNLDKLEERINKKIETVTERQEQQIQEVQNSMQKELNSTLERKVEQISITVGNQVTTQLLGAFQKYMQPMNSIERDQLNNSGLAPMITQEIDSPQKNSALKMIERNTEEQGTVSPEKRHETTEQRLLQDSKLSIKKHDSPHDEFFESNETIK